MNISTYGLPQSLAVLCSICTDVFAFERLSLLIFKHILLTVEWFPHAFRNYLLSCFLESFHLYFAHLSFCNMRSCHEAVFIIYSIDVGTI